MSNPLDDACTACGNMDFVFRWKKFANGTNHIEQRCSGCNHFIRWAPQDNEKIVPEGGRLPPEFRK